MPQPADNDTEHRGGWRPAVLVLDDEWSVLERIKESLQDKYEVKVASRAEEALKIMAAQTFDVVLTDVRMPDMNGLALVSEMKSRYPETQYILMTAFSDIEDTISAIRLGVSDYLRKPFTIGEVRHALTRCLEQRRLKREVASLRAGDNQTLGSLIAKNRRMVEICRLADTVADTDVTVLISGETGTGKGILARAMHNSGPRRERPFVEINCAAIPKDLIESELFGHERGSFTGAVAKKIGRVEVAEGGTLLLDEVGEMPLAMQAKMLRFLQEFAFERVGGTKVHHADVRVIAASNRDLREAVAQGLFREDLFYRLHVIQLHLPPLRDRSEDLPLLADHFLKRFSIKYGRQISDFSAEAKQQLYEHAWPGNVRELEHTVERSVILSRGSRIERLHIGAPAPATPSSAALEASPPIPAEPTADDFSPDETLADYLARCEKSYLEACLARTKGSIKDTARQSGMNPKTLYLKMNRHQLTKEEFRRNPKPGDSDQ